MAKLTPPSSELPALERLRQIMAQLRDGGRGCPWDAAQTFRSILPYTIEEAYEVGDAIERNDLDDLKDELGDLLLQVVFHARMAEELGAFDLDDVARAICDKLVRRHPHVWGDGADLPRATAELDAPWEAIKAEERRRKAPSGARPSVLDGIPMGLPALLRAVKLQKRMARVGFDWSEADPVFDKILEEIGEFRAALAAGNPQNAALELGDLLFTIANLARFVNVDPEDALRTTNAKVVRRFQWLERELLSQNRNPSDFSLDELEELWQQAKPVVG